MDKKVDYEKLREKMHERALERALTFLQKEASEKCEAVIVYKLIIKREQRLPLVCSVLVCHIVNSVLRLFFSLDR